MAYVVLGRNSEVLAISDTINHQENGNVLINNDSIAIAEDLVKECVLVDTIPENIQVLKYCYNAELGFLLNPNWIEPVDDMTTMKNKLDLYEKQLQEQAGAIAELTTLIATMSV